MKKTVALDLRVETGKSVDDVIRMDKAMGGAKKSTAQLRSEIMSAEKEVDRMAATYGENSRSADNARKALAQLSIEYSRQTQAADTLDERLGILNSQVDEGNFGFREATKLIEEYQTIALQAGRESPIGREAIERAAELRDKTVDLRNEVNRLSQDGQALQGALALGTGVVAGYSAFQGVTAMLGAENEELLKTITKLQAAQSTLMGVEQLRALLEKESMLMLQARVLWTNAQTAATGLLTKATAGATKAARAFNMAMSVGILGAIAAAIALIVANWEKLSEVMGISRTEEQKLTDQHIKNSEARRKALDDEISKRQQEIDMMIRKRMIEGASEAELAALRADRTQAAIDSYNSEIEMIDEAIAKRQRMIDHYVEAGNEENKVTRSLREEQEKLLRSRMIIEDELNQIELERREKMRQSQSAIVKMLDDEAEKRAELAAKRIDEDAAATEARLALEAEEQAKLREMQLRNADDEIGLLRFKHERERQVIIEKYGAETELLKELQIQQDAELRGLEEELRLAEQEAEAERRELEYERQRELFELEMEQRALDNEARSEQELEFLNTMYEQGLIAADTYNQGLERLNEDRLKNERDTDLKIAQAKQMLAQESVNLFATLGALMKEGSAAAKVFAGIQIAADTAKALVAAIAGAAAAASAGGPAAPFLLAAYIASGVGAVLAAVGSAKSLLSQAGGSTPSVSVPNIQQPTTPNMSGTAGQAQGGNRVVAGENQTGANMPPTQVVVLASDVQDTNNENNNIDVVSTWG